MRTTDFSKAPPQGQATAMFVGATRYRGPLSIVVLSFTWWRMVRDMKRMRGYRWHKVYWEFPFTLGTLAFFEDRDALMRFARTRHHRRLMQWVTDGTRNATGGYIRVYNAEPEGYSNGVWRAEGGGMAHIETFTPLSTESAGPPGEASVSTLGRVHGLERVESRAGLRDFLSLTDRLHDPGDEPPRFVPPLRAQVRAWLRQGVALYVLRRRRVVARTTLHTDAALDAKLGDRLQLFGLTEFADDAAEELFDAVCAAGRAGGRRTAFGPVSLLPNQAGGVITSGFAERGFIDSAWNPPSYPAAYEAYGFTRRFESDTWICPVPDEPVFAFDDARVAAEGLEVHRGDRRRVAEQLPILRGMLNAAFARLGYYTEISAAQLAAQTDGLAHLLDEDLLLYLTKAGRPIAFVLCLPDISEFVMRVRGDLHLLNQLRLLATRSRHRREAVLVIKGTVPDEQGRGYMRLLSRELHEGLRRGGYHTLRSTYVERTNPGSAAQYVAMGGRPFHGYAFYAKDLT